MIQNNLQINPGNRVDFSRLRKYKPGGNIHKFQNPNQPLQLTQEELNARQNNWGTKVDNQWLTNGQYDFAKMYEYYKAHPTEFKDLDKITAIPTWEGATTNTKGFKDWNTQFNNTNLNKFFGYDANVADYYGPTTSARKGFLDYIKEREAAEQQTRVTTSEATGTQSGSIGTQSEDTGTPSGTIGTPSGTVGTTFTPVTYELPFKYKGDPFTSPITNGAISGINLAAANRDLSLQMQKKVPLLQAPYLQYTVTNNLALQNAYNNQAARYKQLGSQLASGTSSAEDAMRMQFVSADRAEQARLQGELAKTENYNKSVQEGQATANQDTLAQTQTANTNNQNLTVDFNQKLDAKRQYNATKAGIISDNILKTTADYGKWKVQQENERDAQLNARNQYLYNKDLQAAVQPVLDFKSDPTKSQAFTAAYEKAKRDFESNRENSEWAGANSDLVNIFSNSKSAKDPQAFYKYLTSSTTNPYYNDYNTAYTKELDQLQSQSMLKQNEINNRMMYVNSNFPYTYSTQGFYNPRANLKSRTYQSVFKSGGSIRHNESFIKYLEYLRKKEKDIDDKSIKISQQLQQNFRKQLDNIDRETLLLLRSIFK